MAQCAAEPQATQPRTSSTTQLLNRSTSAFRFSPMTPCLSVVMPVFNEEATIQQIVRSVLAQPTVAELIAVDDGSSDRSWEFLNAMEQEFKPRLVLQQHPRNRGKGASIRTGFAIVKSPVVLIQDADLEYDPSEYHKLLEPILDG